jgi:hypothetical protein
VILTTFLFPTMQASPDATCLYRQWRACREDIDGLHLDRLDAFAAGVIRSDPELVRVLEGCGSGPLLVRRDRPRFSEARRDQAEVIRKHLGLAGSS